MSTVSAVTAAPPIAPPAKHSVHDKMSNGPSKTGALIFGLVLIAGLVFIGSSIAKDLSGIQMVSAWPYVLLGLALLVALAFEIRERIPRHGQRGGNRDLHAFDGPADRSGWRGLFLCGAQTLVVVKTDKGMKTVSVLAVAVVVLFPTCLRATPVKPELEVAVLGSGGPRAFGRAGSSYILLVEGVPRILVDAGPGAFLRIGELHLDLAKVDTVLLTHLHIDHSADLAAFFNARALTSDGPIAYRVFGPDGGGLFPKTSRFVDLLVGSGGAFAYQKTFGARESFAVRDLAISLDSARTKIVDDDGLVVEESATHHGDCPSVAYRISYKSVVVVFSGDMDASALPNLVQLAKGANLLVFNCAVLDPPGSPSQLYDLHTPPKKIGEAARESGVKSLLLSHLAPDVEEQQEAVRKSIRGAFAGPVAFASDKLRAPVGK